MRKNKYNNKRVTIDGINFQSEAEGDRYCDLKLLERANEIMGLELQPRYDFEHNGVKIGYYKADFRYYDVKKMKNIVEDVKGVKTAVYNLKKKMMKGFHGIDILET